MAHVRLGLIPSPPKNSRPLLPVLPRVRRLLFYSLLPPMNKAQPPPLAAPSMLQCVMARDHPLLQGGCRSPPRCCKGSARGRCCSCKHTHWADVRLVGALLQGSPMVVAANRGSRRLHTVVGAAGRAPGAAPCFLQTAPVKCHRCYRRPVLRESDGRVGCCNCMTPSSFRN